MVVKLLEAKGSCKGALDYSEKKVSEFVASVAAVRNIPDDLPSTIYDTLLGYESNPQVRAQTRDFRFHMAVNPGKDDTITREQCLSLIDDLMRDMGYAEQPYVVYQHNDIEREHFHVVSVRVDANGKSLMRHFEAPDLMESVKRYEDTYGFTLGKAVTGEEENVSIDSHLSFDASAGDTYSQMRRVFESACRVRVMRREDFFAVLESKGLSCRVKQNRKGEDVLILQGLTPDGAAATKPVTMESRLHHPGFRQMEEWVEQGLLVGVGEMSRVRAEVMVSDALENTATAEHFRRYMREMGYGVTIQRDTDFPQPIRSVRLYDMENATAFCLDELPPSLAERLVTMESRGEWRRSSKREAQLMRGRTLVGEGRRDLLDKLATELYLEKANGRDGRRAAADTARQEHQTGKGMTR